MCANFTHSINQAIKTTNEMPAIVPEGTSKFLQPPDISVKRSFKVTIHWLWEKCMTEGKRYFIKTGWPRIVQARNDMPVSVIIKAFIRGKITADDSSANFQQCLRHQRACALAWQSQHLSTQIQRSQVPLMSLLQTIKWLVVTATPFTWTVKEQYIYIHWCVLMPL